MNSGHRAARPRGAFVALLLSTGLAACQEPPPPPPAEVSRPVPMIEVGAASVDSGLRFPGRVRAVQRAELAFNVPGRIVELPVREGEMLAEGALIARLDPATYELRLAAARAEYDKARTDHERVRRIWEQSKAVARAEVDQKQTAMEVARSGYAAARKEVEDTRLVAPFAGVIARRHVENFRDVQAKEPVVSLQSIDDLEVVIHVPERVVRSEPRRAAGFATFADAPGRRFPVTLKSYATEADPQTQTYEVVLALPRPEGVTVLPGMSVEVLPDGASENAASAGVLVPLKAVAGAADGTPAVWVVDPESARVARRPVEVGDVHGEDVVVLSGLAPGERIVTAGLGHLRDGMLVRPL